MYFIVIGWMYLPSDAGAKIDITDMDGRDAKRIAQEMHYDEIVYQLNTAALTGIT